MVKSSKAVNPAAQTLHKERPSPFQDLDSISYRRPRIRPDGPCPCRAPIDDTRSSNAGRGESAKKWRPIPPAKVVYAANQAEKAANITPIDVRAVGAFGRLTFSGTEGNVDEAAAAAIAAVESPSGT
jgi:hypothetical protein